MTTNPDPIVGVMARAMWAAREETFEPRLRRMTPDAIDMQSGAFAIVALMAGAALQALSEAGYVVVPKEPTEAMIEAERALHGYSGDRTASAYRAMISAVAP